MGYFLTPTVVLFVIISVKWYIWRHSNSRKLFTLSFVLISKTALTLEEYLKASYDILYSKVWTSPLEGRTIEAIQEAKIVDI